MKALCGQPRAPISDEAHYSKVVHAAFGQRRKTLSNALHGLLTAQQIDLAGVDPRARAEQLPPTAFVELARVASLPDNRQP